MPKQSVPTIARAFTLTLLLIAAFAMTHATAHADTVTFQGLTRGCFNCTFQQPRTSPVSYLGLTFQGSTFNVTTTPSGNASLGTAPLSPNNFNNFGSFTLSTEANQYSGTFLFDVLFPDFRLGFLAQSSISGEVIDDGRGNLFINFGNNPVTLLIPGGGSFQLRLNDVSITPGGTVALTGDILNATQPVPEPATMLLLGTGLAGVAARLRRRSRAAKD